MKITTWRPPFLVLGLCSLCPAAMAQTEEAKKYAEAWRQFTVKERPAFVLLPEKKDARSSSKKTPWVFYAPAFEKRLPNPKDEGWMIDGFLAKGIAVAAIDVGESYGSPDGSSLFDALHKHVVENYGFDPKACLLARSRGGLMLYSWASKHPEKVRCIGGIYPVADLRSYPGLAKACGAYEMTEAELAEKLEEYNPIDRLGPLAKAKVPIFHIHGDADKVVPLEKNSAELERRYARLGGSMKLVVAKGQWHNMWRGFFECRELVDFVIGHADRDER